MWNHKRHFYLETVTGEIFSKRNNLHFAFIDLEKAFVLVLGCCMVGLKETSCRRVVGEAFWKVIYKLT